MSAAVDPPETWDGIFEEPLPFIATAAGRDFDDAGGEVADTVAEKDWRGRAWGSTAAVGRRSAG